MNKEEKIFNYIEATWYDIHCKDKKEVRKIIQEEQRIPMRNFENYT